jgi:hypothetical protein
MRRNMCIYKCMLNVYKNQQNRQAGSRNLIFMHIEHTFCICPFLVALIFSATIDGRNLIFGHKLRIGTPYRGKRFLTRQIPTSKDVYKPYRHVPWCSLCMFIKGVHCTWCFVTHTAILMNLLQLITLHEEGIYYLLILYQIILKSVI